MFLCRIGAGITTGTLAILSAQPTDVVKVRMQAETKLAGEPSRYKGVVDAYLTIGKSEGIKGLYKGKTFCYVATGTDPDGTIFSAGNCRCQGSIAVNH